MEVNDFTYLNLSYLIHNNRIKKIPTQEGVYAWVYWREFEPGIVSKDDLYEILQSYSNVDLEIPTLFKNFKYEVKINERKFKSESNPFGISNDKNEALKTYLKSNTGYQAIYDLLKSVYFSKPFYVGKADNLQTRITEHCRANSKIMQALDKNEIQPKYVWVGYKKSIKVNNAVINRVFEEVIQKVLKPGLTQNAG